MKKIIATITVLIMAFSAMIPFVIADDNLDLGGTIEYESGGSSTESIVAIWVTNVAGGDDDTTKMGCQINPPCVYDEYVTVTFYTAIYHEYGTNILDNEVKFDMSWPENDLREELGIGGLKKHDVPGVGPATKAEFDAADILDDIPLNDPFICYRNEAITDLYYQNYSFVDWAYGQSLITFKKCTWDIYYHDPAGWYDMNVTLQTPNSVVNEKMWFEYVLAFGIEIDNSAVDWGKVSHLYQWYVAHGDWDFDTTHLRTVRNIGNWDVVLGANFSHGTFDRDNVLFDVRIGESQPGVQRYNDSYADRYSPDDHPRTYPDSLPFGMYSLIEYWSLPIDNSDELGTGFYNESFLKCHTAKIMFYIYPIQFNAHEGIYTFDIDLLWKAPAWGIVDCHPCDGHTY